MGLSKYFFGCYEPAEADACSDQKDVFWAIVLCVVGLALAVISYFACYNRDWFFAAVFNVLGLSALRAQHQHSGYPYADNFSKCYPMFATGGLLMSLYIMFNIPSMIIFLIAADVVTVYRLYQMQRARTFVFGAQLLVGAVITALFIFWSIAGPEINANIGIENNAAQQQH